MVDWVDRWENEGGLVETAVRLSEDRLKYRFTCLVSEAIRHVRQYFFKRTEIEAQPTVVQQIGEFTTIMRRLLRAEYSDLFDAGFRGLTSPDVWGNVGVPNWKYDYRWNFTAITSSGSYKLTIAEAQILCENALKMANSDKTSDEEFREINNTLDNLLREQVALNSLIHRAKDLNAQADVVVENLYTIAEKLQENH